MIRKALLIIGVIAMLFVMGCNDTGGGSTTTPPTFYGGTQGVIAEFEQMGMEDEGIESVWVDNEFPVEVTVKNKGEEAIAIGDLTVTIQGIDTQLFNIADPEKENEDVLEKISELNQQGGEETINFGTAKLTDMTGLFYDADFFASVVYLYKTHAAVPKVCFKYDFQDESVCELQETKEVFSSGAPIIVATVTQEPSGSKRIGLRFDIENVGGGDVASPNGTFSNLYDQLKFELTEGEGNGIEFTCSSAGNPEIARFNDGKTSVTCRSNELADGTLFTKQVTLELSYKYKDLIQRTVRIRNEPN